MAKKSNLPLAIGAVAFLVGAALVVLVVRNGGDEQALAPSPSDASTVDVLVAKEALPAGTSGRQAIADGLVEQKTLSRAVAGGDAVTTEQELSGRLLTTDLRAGDPIRLSNLQAETLRQDSIAIPEGKQAIALQIPFVAAGGGYVGPGDRINVYGTIKGAPGGSVVRLVLPSVEVLDVSTEVAPNRVVAADQRGDRPTGSAVTYLLALDAQQAAEAIWLAANEGTWITLVPEGQPVSGELIVGQPEVLR